ncbi:MAG TPA: DMT family transporter [Xanthobacteraceae bacterium]|jgi:drug/metabolite transporter (DMT)-like permease
MSRSRETLGLLLGFAGMCLFAGTLPATRLAVSGLDPLFLTVARVTLAGSAALAVLALARRALPPRALRGEMCAAASCTVLGFPLLAAFAMMTVPAAHGGVVFGILPLATTVCAAILTHERPSAGFWLASAAGALIVLAFVLRRGGGESLSAGDLFLLGTVAAGALGYTLSGRLTALMPGWEVISWQVVIFLAPAALATLVLWPSDIARVPLSCWAGLAYVGLVSQYTAFFVFNAAMAMAGIARTGQIMLLQPFMIVALAAAVNGEAISLETVLFAAAVVATVLVAQRMRVRGVR